MAHKGRGNILISMPLICLFSLLLHFQPSAAATFDVPWDFNVVGWPNGKSFKAGDVLVFKYNPALHNVVKVDAAGYGSCKVPTGAPTFNSGNDQITLAKGDSYFICSLPGHCEADMKIAVNAA